MINEEYLKASSMGTWFKNWDEKQKQRLLEMQVRARIQKEILKS
jgi:hypothetical protein